MSDRTTLIRQVGKGDRDARDQLFAAAYSELRKLARSRLRNGGRNTHLGTAALVHESFLRFLNVSDLRIEDRLVRASINATSSVERDGVEKVVPVAARSSSCP